VHVRYGVNRDENDGLVAVLPRCLRLIRNGNSDCVWNFRYGGLCESLSKLASMYSLVEYLFTRV
jgi:hypothetical protein